MAVDGRERGFGAWLQAVARGEPDEAREDERRCAPSVEAEEIRAVLAAVEAATLERGVRPAPGRRSSGSPLQRLPDVARDEMQVVIGGDVAFVLRLGEPSLDVFGRRTGGRPRTTYGLSRIGDQWVVVHEHEWTPPQRETG